MSNHLSQDQISMCILGRATPEEQQHGRECSECSAELARFQEPISTFRVAMQDWSDRENVPRLAQISIFLKPRRLIGPVWGWVSVTMAVMIVVLTAVPIYVQQSKLQQTQAEEATRRRDALLIEAVNAHLARTLPTPMEPILALVPDQESVIQPGGIQ